MDVLYNSIDIQSLLPTPPRSDASTPLSGPDLRLLISNLEVHSLNIKSRVQSYVISHHRHFSDLFSQCATLVSRSDHLHSRLIEFLSVLDSDVDLGIKAVIKGEAEAREELRVKREVLEVVGVVLEVIGGLGEVRRGVVEGRVKEAAELLRDLKIALWRDGDGDGGGGGEGTEPVVYSLLKEDWEKCFEEMQNVLVKFMEDAVCFNQEAASVSVKYWLKWTDADLVKLPTVLEAMDAVGLLDYAFAKIADMMIKYVVTPVVKGQAIVSTTDELDQYPENITEVVLDVIPLTGAKADDSNGETVYSPLIQVIKFVNRSLCFQNSSWMYSFGRLTWARMSELIISSFLSKTVPDDASKLVEFQKIVKLTSEFEGELKELMFISSDSKDQRLSIFAENVEVHFASKKKVEILTKARALLLQSEFSIPQQLVRKSDSKDVADIHAHTVDLLFTSEKCIISEAARNLMEFVHETLKDVCVSPPRVGLEFYHAIRDALLLYEAVIPVKLERQLESVNQAAVLIHNDCLYLSTEIVGLAFEYRSAFPNAVREQTVFVDLSPRYQILGEQIFQREVQLVLYNLNMAIDGADGFQNTHQSKQYESAKFSMDQVVFILEKVRMIWEHLLLPSIYEKSMSMVIDVVFSKIAKEILLLDDMAAEETLQLRNLILLLLENLSPLLESLLANNERSKSQEGELQRDHTPLQSMQKLRKLADLLDMPLKSITTSWESGELVSCGFTPPEMKDFIRAIFTDSPLRKECLFRIESS